MEPRPITSDARWRAEWEARYMPDSRLAALIAEGPQGLDPALWQILLNERANRDRRSSVAPSATVKKPGDGYEPASSDIVLGKSNRRYPALASIVVLVKVTAVMILIAGFVLAAILYRAKQPAQGAVCVTAATFWTLLTWAAAESIAVLTDIEANTRATAGALRGNVP